MGSKFSYKNKNTVFVLILSFSLIALMLILNLDIFNKQYPIPETTAIESEDETEESYEATISELKVNTTIFVHIDGEVNKPGVVELSSGSRLNDAVALAGGLTEKANTKGVNLAQKVEDGLKYIIPDDNSSFEILGDTSINTKEGQSSTEQVFNGEGKLNVNQATKENLMELPGIGEVLSQRILDYRDENGEFKSVEDLKNVEGIGDKKFEDMKNKICIE